MLGFFDSGFGGLTVLKEAIKLLPQYSYIYLGDNARAPYGDRSREEIYQFTKEGVRKLFELGAELVILACNTSSSVALRRIQQEWLPHYWRKACPERSRRVLGIIIPTAEEAGRFTRTRKVGVLSTKATAASFAYPKEIKKINPSIEVYQQACPLLVPLVEEGETDSGEIDDLIQIYLDELFLQSSGIDTLILGCTHYALIENQIRRHLPQDIAVISQGPIIAAKLKEYLVRHPEIKSKLEKNGSTRSPQAGERRFLSSERSKKVEALSALFYGEPIKIEAVSPT